MFTPSTKVSRQPAQPLRLLFVGRLVPYKGVELLVRAAALAARRYPLQLDLLVCSADNDYKAFLVQLANDLGFKVEDCQPHSLSNPSGIAHHASHIRFLPAVPRSELPLFYQQCDLFCFPTLCDTYGIALLEAMSCGCAVLASDVAGAGEIINDDNGLKVPLTRPAEYIAQCADKIVACAQNPELRARLGANARNYILAHHDWTRVTSQLLSVYDELDPTATRDSQPGNRPSKQMEPTLIH